MSSAGQELGENVNGPSNTSDGAARESIDTVSRDGDGNADDECIVCLQRAVVPFEMSCDCKFKCCESCILTWLTPQEKTQCPWCRRCDVFLRNELGEDVSETFYEEGRKHLSRFFASVKSKQIESSSFDEKAFKEPLFDATDCFLRSICANRANAKPYNGMATLAVLIKNRGLAMQYVSFVLENLDGSNALALELLHQAERLCPEPSP